MITITWDTNSISNTYPFYIDNINTWSQNREGSDYHVAVSGERDAWILGTDYYLTCDLRWIPVTGDHPVTWSDIETMLEYGRQMLPFQITTPVGTVECFLHNVDATPTLEANSFRRVTVTFISPSTPFEGV